jgi:hypothetical protein
VASLLSDANPLSMVMERKREEEKKKKRKCYIDHISCKKK